MLSIGQFKVKRLYQTCVCGETCMVIWGMSTTTNYLVRGMRIISVSSQHGEQRILF